MRKGPEELVQRLSSTEQLAPLIRGAIEKGWSDSFLQCLDEYEKKRREEIEMICTQNYAEFIRSVQEILKMRADVTRLKTKVFELNSDIQHTGQEALDVAASLEEQRQLRRNVDDAIVVTLQCVQLATLATAVKEELDSHNIYGALKARKALQENLQEQQHVHMRPVVQRLRRWLPEVDQMIKSQAISDCTDWLVEVSLSRFTPSLLIR
jgi:hypothetical protein